MDLSGAGAVRGPRVGPNVCWVRRRLVRTVAAPQVVRPRLALEPRVADAHDVAGLVGRAGRVDVDTRAAGKDSGLLARGARPDESGGVGAVGGAARAGHARGRDVLLVVALVDRRGSGRLDLARGRGSLPAGVVVRGGGLGGGHGAVAVTLDRPGHVLVVRAGLVCILTAVEGIREVLALVDDKAPPVRKILNSSRPSCDFESNLVPGLVGSRRAVLVRAPSDGGKCAECWGCGWRDGSIAAVGS